MKQGDIVLVQNTSKNGVEYSELIVSSKLLKKKKSNRLVKFCNSLIGVPKTDIVVPQNVSGEGLEFKELSISLKRLKRLLNDDNESIGLSW